MRIPLLSKKSLEYKQFTLPPAFLVLTMNLILASTSPYRKRLLQRLQIPFHCVPPKTDETAHPGETAKALARRLAQDKARAVAASFPEALVIGSDQVASLDGQIIGKPGSFDRAREQLRGCSGRDIRFHTAVALVSLSPPLELFHVEPTTVHFRNLSDSQIEDYLRQDKPYDCAGSFKVEARGITLFTGITSNDPTALEGLPLITLTGLLCEAGMKVL